MEAVGKLLAAALTEFEVQIQSRFCTEVHRNKKQLRSIKSGKIIPTTVTLCVRVMLLL